jgi:integrase
MAKALTTKAVENAKPDGNRREIPDGLLTGLYLVVQPTGAKSWAVRYRHGGKPRKLTLGAYPAIELGDAREAAKEALQAVAKGKDPATQKKADREEARAGRNLFENVVAEFLERHAKGKRTYSEIKRMFDHDVIPAWKGRRVQEITRRDVIELMDGLTDRGVGTMTNRVFSIIRKLFNWAVSRDIVTGSPCVGMRPPAQEASRDRVLSNDEIQRFWKATGAAGYPFGPLFRLLLITGQRLSEVAEVPWAEIDLEKRVWSLPKERTKNGRAHEVPLSDLAIETIECLPRIAGTRRLLFTTTGDTPVSGFSRAKKNLDTAMTADADWILHDLRRTVATGLQRLAIPPHVTEAVLNHKSGVIKGVAAVYSRYEYSEEKRSALDAWARRLREIVEGRKADNVIELQSKSGRA